MLKTRNSQQSNLWAHFHYSFSYSCFPAMNLNRKWDKLNEFVSLACFILFLQEERGTSRCD